ncbi:Pkinase Tyr and/or ANF receptor domain containing protein [Asbolus verrucosus]|uniref:guanylate cyclase n=1 Tax=Asbolus verrucosus TaxID=1661398 RepID=A0A482WBU2_ASBVE|nr:Pkinase Tyr and/or ANF receptor domain containing protein [Asbolus verrucosus]
MKRKNLEHGLKKRGLLTFMRELDGNDNESIDNYLRDASMYARVVILSVRGVLVRRFMLAAHALGMTKGDWTFLDVEIFQGSYWRDHDWEAGDNQDAAARKAYEALLRVSLLQPTSDQFQDFADRVKERAFRDYNYTISDGEEINFVIGAFYDGVHLLGMALNETLSEGGDIRNGLNITTRMWSRDFHGITGHVRIDDNGDRDADYSVLDLDPITGKFEVVAHYYGVHKRYSPVTGKKIHWPGGREGPPPDIPPCGFMNNNPECRNQEAYMVIVYGSFAFGIFLAFIMTFVCVCNKQMRIAADLNNMSWRIRPEEVIIEVGKPFGSKLALQKLTESYGLRSGRASITSTNSLQTGKVFTTVGIYKGSRVAIKKITKKKVDINKKLLWEIKQVRDVTHENTVRFLGACIECPTVLILTEYCPRGSLKDVLENEAIQLDWNFRMSLIHDIVKVSISRVLRRVLTPKLFQGMSFLHSCEVSVHGKLRSCNCLIDGRFVLKISDFGLATLTMPLQTDQDSDYYQKMLWVAPELLPLTVIPGTPATQKGDVYSFSIILEEIIVRGGPYEAAGQFLEPHEIIARVAARENPPFRPAVSRWDCPEDLVELMERCWSDNPEDRPTFETLKITLRGIMK